MLSPQAYRSPELFPDNWTPQDGCPASRRGGNPAHVPSDAPIRSTYGPRPLKSQGDRYDFHRGIDLPAPIGTPAFAIADGIVQDAGIKSSYSDPVIIIKHYRPGFTSCNKGGQGPGCFYAMYIHMRLMDDGEGCCAVTKGQKVVAGQLLGYTGVSSSGFEHLHFEIRDAPWEDPYSKWSRDTVHPLGVLPYSPDEAGYSDGSIVGSVSVTAVDPGNDIYNVTVVVETARHDILGVELSVLDLQQQPVLQPGDTPTVPGTWGYNIRPSSFIFQVWSRQWSHKSSSSVPWSEFQEGGAHECPYFLQHSDLPDCDHATCSYSAHYHMDRADPADAKTGLFNGVRVHLQDYGYYREGGYWMRVSFEELVIPGGPGSITATLPLGAGMQSGAEAFHWVLG